MFMASTLISSNSVSCEQVPVYIETFIIFGRQQSDNMDQMFNIYFKLTSGKSMLMG